MAGNGIYGHLDVGMRFTSWSLLKSLKRQCDLPWFVFGVFN